MTPLNQPGCTFDFQRYTPAVSKASKVHPGRFKGVHGRCPNGVRMYLYRASGRLDAVPAARRAPPGAATKVKTIFYLSVGRGREATAAAWGAPPRARRARAGPPRPPPEHSRRRPTDKSKRAFYPLSRAHLSLPGRRGKSTKKDDVVFGKIC